MFAHIFGDVTRSVGQELWQGLRLQPKRSCTMCKGRGLIGLPPDQRPCPLCGNTQVPRKRDDVD